MVPLAGAGYQSRMNAVLRAYRTFCEEEGSKKPAAPVRRGPRAHG